MLILSVQEQTKKNPGNQKTNTNLLKKKKKKRNSKNKSAYINGEKPGIMFHVSQTAEDGNPILNKNSGARSTSH